MLQIPRLLSKQAIRLTPVQTFVIFVRLYHKKRPTGAGPL
jgi:hypothetical protein